MRKSFTRFFGLLLILLVSFGSYAQTLSPTAGATNQKTTVEMSATYANNVTAVGTKYVRLYENNGTVGNVLDDTPLFVQPATDSKVIVSGKKVTFDFNSLLVEGKTYYIAVDAGAFLVGSTPNTVIAQEAWSFTTGDWTAPVLKATNPLLPKDGAINVENVDPISVTFSENVVIDPTVAAGANTGIYLMKDNGTGYGDVVEVFKNAAPGIVVAGATITLTPTAALLEKTNYYILIENGAVVDNSVNNNKFAGFIDEGKIFADKTWGFSTKDMSAPVVNPITASATKTTITVSVTVNEAGKVWVDRALTGGAAPTAAALKVSGTAQLLTFTAAGMQTATWTVPAAQAAVYDIFYVSETNINYTATTEVTSAVGTKTPVNLVDGINPALGAPAFTPADDAAYAFPVPKNQKFTIKFNESVKIATGKVYVRKAADNSNFFEGELSSVGTVKTNVNVEMTFPTFASEGRYYIILEAGAVTDLADNPFVGIPAALPQSWNFAVVDYLPPTFTMTPANGANVNPPANITFTFNENIYHSAPTAGNAVARTIAPTGNSVNNDGLQEAFELYENGTKVTHVYTFNGTTGITLAPAAGIKDKSTYRVIFYPYWIEDLAGNAIPSPVDYTFTTKDVTPPVISSFGPATVEKNSNLTATFSEAIRFQDATAVTNANVASLITLRRWGGAAWTTVLSTEYSVSINDAKTVITVDPTFDFPSGGQYRLTIAQNLEDMSGNNLNTGGVIPGGFGTAPPANPSEKDYTVTDYVPPVITLTPANGASVNPGTTIVITSTEAITRAIDGGVVNGSVLTLREGGMNGTEVVLGAPAVAGAPPAVTYTFTPAPALNPAKTYYLAVDDVVKDAAGNVNVPVSSTFTTQSVTAPDVAGWTPTPANLATLQPANVAVTVVFDEPVILTGGVGTVSYTANGGAPIAATSVTLGADKKTLTIGHAAFPSFGAGQIQNNNIVFTLAPGTVTSQTGTAQTGNITWAFGSFDNAAPTATAYNPVLPNPAPAGVAVNIKPTVTFSEDIVLTSVAYAEIRRTADDFLLQTLAGDQLKVNYLASGKNVLTLLPIADLAYNTGYYIFIPPNVISDVSGANFFAGVVNKPADEIANAANQSWDFTTAVNPGVFTLDVAKSVPTMYQDNVALDADLTVDFNRALSGVVDPTLNWTLYKVAGFNTVTGVVTGPLTIADQYSTVDPSMTISGDKVIINPTLNLTANSWYIIRFSNGFVKDTYNTLLTGASAGVGGAPGNMDFVGLNPSDIIFTTGTAQGPIASFQPANAATGITKSSNIVVTFDEAFKAAGGVTVTTGMLEAWPSTMIQVNGTLSGPIQYNATISGNSIVIDPVNDFNIAPEVITVTVLANQFFDASGNTYKKTFGDGIAVTSPTDDQAASFTPEDLTGPIASISAGFPTSTKGTEVNYKVQSNEKGFVYSLVIPTPVAPAVAPTAAEIKANTATVITTISAANTASAAITKTGLTPKTQYNVYVVGIDQAGNTGAVATHVAALWTPDDVAPAMTATAPATPAAQNAAITITFNDDVLANAGYLTVREKETQNLVALWDVTALGGTSTIGGAAPNNKKAIFNLGGANGEAVGVLAAWDSEVTYVVRLDPGAVTDPAFALSVPASGLNPTTSAVEFEFKVKDWIAPTIIATSPAVSAVGAAPTHTGQNISITFSENMTPTAVLIRIYEDRLAGAYPADIIPNNEIETIDPNTVSWNADNTKATFSISHYLLKAVTEYYVEVAAGCFKDDGNNTLDLVGPPAWPGAGNAFQFKTPDETTLTATHTFTPAPTALNPTWVPVNTVIDVDFGTDQVVWTAHPYVPYLVDANVDSIAGLYDATGARVAATITIANNLAGGDHITITPTANLKSFTNYTVKITPIQDVNGNKVLDLAAQGCEFTFMSGDGDAPVLTFTPPNNTIEAPEGGPFVIEANEAIYAATGLVWPNHVTVIDNNVLSTYVVLQTAAGAAIAHTATISADYKTITITPTANIASQTVVRYGFKTGVAVSDYYGNQINGGATQNILNTVTTTANAKTFAETTIRDYAAPTVLAGGYLPVGPTTSTAAMRMLFNEDIAIGSGNLYIREQVTGDIIETIAAADVTVINNDLTWGDHIVIPHANFPMNTQFYITIDAGFVTDTSPSKNAYAGISDANAGVGGTWTFNTADATGPQVKIMTPAPASSEVLLEQDLVLIFDQPVQAGAGNIVIYEEDGTPYDIIPVGGGNVDFNVQYAAGGGDTIVTVSHLKFKDASTYFVRIDAGAITDKAVPANNYVGIMDRSWTFTTEDYTPANYTIVNPLDNAVGVALMPTFELTFNRAIQAGTGKIQLWKRAGDVKLQEINATDATIAADGMSVTFTFPNVLPEATDLYIIVNANAFVNASISHVPFVGITTQWQWNFTTETDATAPTLMSVVPDAATGLNPADVVLELTLSEDVIAGTGNIVIYNAADDQMVETIAIGDATIAGAKVTVTPTALAEQMSYYVLVDAGAVTDKSIAANPYAGIADKTVWTFSTGDFTAPTVLSVSPDGATLDANHPELVLTLTEDVVLSTAGGNVTITMAGETTASVTIPLTAAMINGAVVTITYPNDGSMGGLDKNTDYFVSVDADALEDNAGNAFAGVTDATTWTFKTGADFATGNKPVIGSLELKVYPNPFVNELRIDNASALSRIIITSMTGQKVKEIVNPTSTIQTNELRSGVYFISLYVDDVVAKTERIVKR